MKKRKSMMTEKKKIMKHKQEEEIACMAMI